MLLQWNLFIIILISIKSLYYVPCVLNFIFGIFSNGMVNEFFCNTVFKSIHSYLIILMFSVLIVNYAII